MELGNTIHPSRRSCGLSSAVMNESCRRALKPGTTKWTDRRRTDYLEIEWLLPSLIASKEIARTPAMRAHQLDRAYQSTNLRPEEVRRSRVDSCRAGQANCNDPVVRLVERSVGDRSYCQTI